ncbi:tRNA lysidine(34) synthetase TilS [Atopomonas sediminilitoris]|uniref:tRNA lysidine(34) synthetase TilS n=1 Tax=Atopomonas sediminilitoris TaxID=2919919 RepID=UPI001F4D9370|nr:tRNA lysidine(34) synthetase TilS [Atopomonas sediminilitoris]MCJ8169726.1 tRNA lysidine(34) synthetase TilS [Atopomonas sediminilitoris]
MFAWAGEALLARLAPWRQAPAWRVAFSGGLDSTVLLHTLAQCRLQHDLPPLSALHVHHGLQTLADDWVTHCQAQCAALSVPCQIQFVHVATAASVEAQAREARYAAFAQVLQADELLLLAQHADDQAETVLYRLLRGAGVHGLAAMPESRALPPGHLCRPLLAVPRAQLLAYAQHYGLEWIEDPSNQDVRLDRNYLRQHIVPALQARWPAALSSLQRAAQHAGEADSLLGELAQLDLQAAAVDLPAHLQALGLPCLSLAALRDLSEARQRNALRHWLAPLTALPDTRHWQGWLDLLAAGASATPVWRLQAGSVQRAEGLLWWLPAQWQAPVAAVSIADRVTLPNNGVATLLGSMDPAVPLEVRYRQDGAQINLPGRGSRDLKRYLREQRIPAFLRARWPLLYAGEQFLGLANFPALYEHGPQLIWQPPTVTSV